MYRFVDLSDAQKHERRELLYLYAAVAQISVFAPLLLLQVYFLVKWTNRRWQAQADLEMPSSPHLKSDRSRKGWNRFRFTTVFRKAVWWSGDSITVLRYDLGRKGEVLLAVVWASWLLLLCFMQTGDDYLHLTKRFGIVAASQIPLHYMLALKSPYSPLQILTRLSHESINVTHQLLGRIVTFLLYAHAALYLNFYVQKNLLGSKLQEAYIICGIVGIICFTIVGTTALSPVRRWSYRVFYITHVVLATVLLPVLFFHVSYIRIYLYETAAIYILNAAMRFVNTGTYTGTITHVDETNLLGIQVPLSAAKPNGRLDTKWEPGQHVYLSLKSHPLMRTFRSNPFTVASLPAVDRRLRFVARILDGNTATLARSVKEGKAEGSRVGLKQSITLEGPYGIPTHADRLLRYDRVLFVAGGVGATFIVPLYRQLLSDLSPSKGSYRRTKVQFVWAVRSAMEVQWALPEDGEERRGFAERAKIYITGDGGTTFLRKGHNSVVGYDDEVPKEPPPDMEDGIELEEQQNLLSSRPDRVALADTGGLHFRSGRPNLARLVDGAFSHGITEKVAILVCGPRSLSCSLRREVGRWVYRERDVWFWDESFGL